MGRKRILMVDDSNTVLMMNKLILSKEGYEILTAGDGAEGVATARRERPDLILMDVVMPNMGGFEAVEALRQHPETQAIPVIMVTTRGEEDNITKGFEVGCDDYVTKPVNGPELLAKIRSRLGH